MRAALALVVSVFLLLTGAAEAQPLGTACGAASECDSGFCQDGVCCNTVCNGTCDRCDTPVPGFCTVSPDDCGACGSCKQGATKHTCVADVDLCEGNCPQCTDADASAAIANFVCSANPNECGGSCSECIAVGDAFNCTPNGSLCSGSCIAGASEDDGARCTGSGKTFNCAGDAAKCVGDCDKCAVVGSTGGRKFDCASAGGCTGCGKCSSQDANNWSCASDDTQCSGNCSVCALDGGSGYTCQKDPDDALCGECGTCVQNSAVKFTCAAVETECEACETCSGTNAFSCVNQAAGTTDTACPGAPSGCYGICDGAGTCSGSGACDDGTECTANGDCASGFCVDGVCCESACAGKCKSCSVPAKEGQCVNIAKDSDPDNECLDIDACESSCNGKGSCDVNCGNIGETCTSDAACPSGNCVDGVCCDSACSGVCETCAGASPGQCDALTDGSSDPTCDAPKGCTAICGVSGCEVQCGLGTACLTASDCESGHCVDGVCCESACAGSCVACDGATPGTCASVGTDTDPDNECPDAEGCVSVCGASGKCSGACGDLGRVCASGDECATGFCVDGVCCASACDGECLVCNGAVPGICDAIADATQCTGGCCTAGACGTCSGAGGAGGEGAGGNPASGGAPTLAGSGGGTPGAGGAAGGEAPVEVKDVENCGCRVAGSGDRRFGWLVALAALGLARRSRSARVMARG